MFGANFAAAGLQETATDIGYRFRVGSAEVMVTQPRLPCYKLGIRFGRTDIIKRFLASERTGFYFSVMQEGEVGAGDEFTLIERDKQDVKVTDIVRLYATERGNVELLRRAIEAEALPESWRDYFLRQLEKLPTERSQHVKT